MTTRELYELRASIREEVRAAVRDENRELRAEIRALTDLVRSLAERRAPSQAVALLTRAEFARQNAISVSTVRAAEREGRLDVTRIGRSVRVAADAVIRPRSHTKGDRVRVAMKLVAGGRS